MNGWLDDVGVHVLFNSITVLLGRSEVDNERLFAKGFLYRLERLPLQAGLEQETTRPAVNPLSYRGSFWSL